MAKQSGIHQLRGKVGEMSYYRQKGVEPGLARKINQGLSARVKNDEAYANTRLNNLEFKHANQLAAIAFNSVSNRKRGMMVNFAIAAMTKRALQAIKEGTGAWGDRRPEEMGDSLLCDMLESHAKSGVYDSQYGSISVDDLATTGAGQIAFDIDEQLATQLKNDGIDAITFVCQQCAIGITASGTETFVYGGTKIGTVTNQPITSGQSATVALNVSFGSPEEVNMVPPKYAAMRALANHGFYAVISILPARSQGGSLYTLQEKCTFVAVSLGKIPTT